MLAHGRVIGVLAALLVAAACDGSSPTAPTGPSGGSGTLTTYRGSVVASADVLAAGLRIVAGTGTSAPVAPSGEFEIVVTDASVRLRLVGPDLDVPIVLAAIFDSDLVELQLRLDRGAVIVVSACGVTVSVTPNGGRVEARLCAGR